MKYRHFGSLGTPVSVIGFGTWAIGGNSYGPVDDIESVRALEYAYDKGINFYDTANIYGSGHSEILLRKTFKDKRDKIVLTTKAGYKDYGRRIQDFSESFIRKSIEGSLRRLDSDYVDILFLHSPPREVISSSQAYDILCKLKDEGKIRYNGVSVRTADDGLLALQKSDYDTLELTYNLLDQSPKDNGLIELALNRKTFLVAKAPLCYGFLTGKYTTNSQFGQDDHRHCWPRKQRDRWITDAESFEFLCDNSMKTISQAVLQFCMVREDLILPIPGMKTVKQVEENIAATFAPPLTKHELHKIQEVYSSISSRL